MMIGKIKIKKGRLEVALIFLAIFGLSYFIFSNKSQVNYASAAAAFQATGTVVSGAAVTLSPTWPTHQANDVALLFVEDSNQTVTLSNPAGFTQITNSPQSTGTAGAAGATRITVFWARATSSTMSAPTIAATTDHAVAQIITFRGLVTSGDPTDITAGAIAATASTTAIFPTVTTTVPNDVIVLASADDLDSASTAVWSAWTNAALTSITERTDTTVSTGNGGGLGIATGMMASAGATGTSKATHTSSITTQMTIALKPQLYTTISNLVTAEPASVTINPGVATSTDSFGLVTTSGTDTVTAATVTLASGKGQYIQTVAITNDTNTTTYCSASPSGDTASLSSCTIPVTTTNTQFKIVLTAKSHASMPSPPGGLYTVTAVVSAFTSTQASAGTDSGSATTSINNQSPISASAVWGDDRNTKNIISWYTSTSTDFNLTNGSVVYRWTSASAGSEVPNGDVSPVIGNTYGAATAACVVSSAASTTLLKIDGPSGSADCASAALTNGQAYTYKVFQQNTSGNYDAGVLIGTFTPNGPPTMVLNDPTDASSTSSTKPTFQMTATDPEGDKSQYEFQLSTSSSFATIALDKTSVRRVWVGFGGAATTTNSIAYSYDGINWTGLGGNIFKVQGMGGAWNGSMFVAAGGNGGNTLAYSYDGLYWTGITGTTIFSTGRGVAWNGTMWVATGTGTGTNNVFAHSYDGLNWTGDGGSAIFSNYADSVGWNGTQWVATGYGSTYSMASSTDGINWTALSGSKTLFSTTGYDIVWNGTVWVAGGYGTNALAYSSNGTNWTGTGSTVYTTGAFGVAWNGSMWMTTGNDSTNNFASSTASGATWTKFGGKTIWQTGYGYCVGWDGTMWVAGGVDTVNTIAYSYNGGTWVGVGKTIFNAGMYAVTSNSKTDNGVGFINTANTGEIPPFTSGQKVSYTIQTGNELTPGTTYYWRARAVDTPGSNTWGAWTTGRSLTVNMGAPTLTSYTNSTESALNYAASCTNCGARIGPSAGFRQSITITGTNFGADPGVGNRSTATNNVMVGTHKIASANVTAWSATSITFLTDSSVTGDTDTDWGSVYGGASSLKVTAGSQTSTGLNFYVFPQVISITTPSVANAAREYNAADSDGVITLNGTCFGSGATGGWTRIFGCDVSTCSSPSGSATINSWSSTAIAVQVPAVINDNVYTGSVIIQQGAGTNFNTHTFTTTGFRILPRMTGWSETSGIGGDSFNIGGDHFCQNGGTCPTVYNSTNFVSFSTAATTTVFTSWSYNLIQTVIPNSAVTGNMYIQSNAYNSNSINFTIYSTIPYDPNTLSQFTNSSLSPALSTGGVSSSSNIYLTMNIPTIYPVSGGTLYPQIEYEPVGTAFSCIGTSTCAQAVEGAGTLAQVSDINCGLTSAGCAISTAPVSDNVYHWQARIRHNRNSVNYYSNWVSYGGNSESGTDFQIDRTAPTISFSGSNTCSDAVSSITTNGAIISWTLNESGVGQVEYSKNSSLSGSTISTLDSSNYSHAYTLSNLDLGSTYYFRIKSSDAAGNLALRPTSSPYCSFTTASSTNPFKTAKFYIGSNSGMINAGSTASSTFLVNIPENSVSIKSAFFEISGMSTSGSNNNLNFSINGNNWWTAVIPWNNNWNNNTFNLIVPVNPSLLLFDPTTNTFSIQTDQGIYISAANLVLTYSYTP